MGTRMLQPSQRYLVGYIELWKPRTLPQTKPCVMQDQSLIRSTVCDISWGSVGGGDVPLPDSSRALTTHHSLIPQYQKNLVTIFQGHGKSEAQLSSLPASRKSIVNTFPVETDSRPCIPYHVAKFHHIHNPLHDAAQGGEMPATERQRAKAPPAWSREKWRVRVTFDHHLPFIM